MITGAARDWRYVAPIARADAERLQRSDSALGRFLAERFTQAFGKQVEEVLFETFPDGLAVTLFVEGRDRVSYNVWGAAVASALADAGVEVSVVVRPGSDRFEESNR